MNSLIVIVAFASSFIQSGLCERDSAGIRMSGDKLSICAESVSLRHLIDMLDDVTGMNSKVPAELANRPISVRLSGLTVSDAIRKMLETQRIDYILVWGETLIITGVSKEASMQTTFVPPVQDQPALPDSNQSFVTSALPPEPAQKVKAGAPQPAATQTPFGPIANPDPNPAAPTSNNLFGNTSPPTFVDDPKKSGKK
jgi:hypothetical protein